MLPSLRAPSHDVVGHGVGMGMKIGDECSQCGKDAWGRRAELLGRRMDMQGRSFLL